MFRAITFEGKIKLSNYKTKPILLSRIKEPISKLLLLSSLLLSFVLLLLSSSLFLLLLQNNNNNKIKLA